MTTNSNQKIIRSLFIFAGVMVTGIIGYMVIEGWRLIDAAFMTVITLGTVGYGETNPLSPQGRIFTIFLIIFGLGAAASVLNSFATVLIETKLDHFFGRNGMHTELKRMKEHVILCGFGQIGMIIALRLKEKQIPVVIIEEDAAEIEKIKQLGFVFVEGSLVADTSLLLAGIERAKSLVVCVPDLTINLTLALAAKELNPKIEFIAQGEDRALESRILRAGATTVVYPIALGGEQISDLVAQSYLGQVLEENMGAYRVDGFYLKLYRHFSEEPLTVNEAVKKEKGIRAVSWRSENMSDQIEPNGEWSLKKGDSLVILIKASDLNDIGKDQDTLKPSKIIWNDNFSVGIVSIDEEHLRLVNLINQFNEALADEKAQSIIITTFDQLIAYSLEHFKNEEALMRAKEYPDLDAHILEHQRLMDTVMALNQEKNYIFPRSVSEFLNMWLIDHILACDKQFMNYLRKLHNS